MRKSFSWGANSYGQLAQGNQDDMLIPSEIRSEDIFKHPCHIVGGGGHTLVLTEKGDCYVCGSNDKGQLGIGVKEKNVLKLQRLQILDGKDKIVKISAGWDFSFVLTENKDLYGSGSNSFGQLACDQTKGFTNIPVKVSSGVKDVCCGLRHSLIIKDSGEIFACGAAKKGQTGVNFQTTITPRDVKVFTKVDFPEGAGKVCSVKAGEYHSLALTDSGKIFSWGSNKYGQLACNPEDVPILNHPTEICPSHFNHQKIAEIHSGWSHVVAVTERGEVYTWGRGEYSQLGREPYTSSCHQPKPVPALQKPQQIATGSEHTLLLAGGVVYSWGWNEHGMCGTGTEEDVNKPEPVEHLNKYKALSVACGAGHSFAVVEDS